MALVLALAATVIAAVPDAPGNPNAGAKLVQNNGCMGCHGAKFEGGIGPKLLGIEHRLSPKQIADFIRRPRAPMPNFGFSDAQIDDIVAYLSNLDGGAGDTPVVTLDPATPKDRATIRVRFPKSIPHTVKARAIMYMGSGSHHHDSDLHPTADPRVWEGTLEFSMGGAWTVQLIYDDKQIDIPLTVSGGT